MMTCVASGRVLGDPVEVGTDRDSMAVFVLAIAEGTGPHPGPGLRARGRCEVLCRGTGLKRAVLHGLSNGDDVLVMGEQHLLPAGGPIEDDLTCATVQIEASAIGIDLDSLPAST